MLGDIVIFVGTIFVVVSAARYVIAPRLSWPLPMLLAAAVTQTVATTGLLGANVTVKRLGNAAIVLGAAGWLIGLYRRRRRQRRAQRTADARQVASIPGVGKNPQSVVLSADEKTAYVPAADRGTLAVVDLNRRAVRSLIRVGRGATDALPLPSSDLVLVSTVRLARGELVIVDSAAGQVTGVVAKVREPRGMAISPDRASVYVTSMCDRKVFRLDARTLAITRAGDVGERPVAVSASPCGRRVYVADWRSPVISILDSGTLRTTATVTLPRRAAKLALDTSGDVLYAACADGAVAVVDTRDCKIIATGRPGEHEGDVATGGADGADWYVTDPWGGTLLALTARSVAVSEAVLFGKKAPIGVARAATGLLYVICQTGTLDIVRF